jgi:DNA (cytosine-5)-methyltransferase 1
MWKGCCLTVKATEEPTVPTESSMLEVVEFGAVPERFFLSPNAARGMIRRADKMKRHFLPELRAALEALSEMDSGSESKE